MHEFPTVCDACGANLKLLNPIYTIRDDKRRRGWCSRRCRSKETNEDPGPDVAQMLKKVATEPPSGHAIRNHSLVASDTPAATGKQAAPPKPASSKPTVPPKSNNIKESVDKPWRNLNGKMYHVKGAKVPNMTGLRKQVYQLIKDGMKVSELYAACEKAGLEGPQNLRTITHIYKIVEVK